MQRSPIHFDVQLEQSRRTFLRRTSTGMGTLALGALIDPRLLSGRELGKLGLCRWSRRRSPGFQRIRRVETGTQLRPEWGLRRALASEGTRWTPGDGETHALETWWSGAGRHARGIT